MTDSPKKTLSANARAARVIGRTCFAAVAKQKNATISKEQLKQGWAENKKQYVKLGERIARDLERRGYRIVAAASVEPISGANLD